MKATVTFEVNECGDCPFLNGEQFSCQHPNISGEGVEHAVYRHEIADVCPLKKGGFEHESNGNI